MMSSDPNAQDSPKTDYIHDEKRLDAEIREIKSQNDDLDGIIQTLRKRGYGILWICRGLKPHTNLDPMILKRRVLKVVREM